MPGGRLNPFSVNSIMEQFGGDTDANIKAKEKKHEKTLLGLKQKMSELGLKTPFVDLSIMVNYSSSSMGWLLNNDIKYDDSSWVHQGFQRWML